MSDTFAIPKELSDFISSKYDGSPPTSFAPQKFEELRNEFNQKQKLKKEQDEKQKQREAEEVERLKPIKNNLEYSDEIAQEICERVSAGELLIHILNESHMPSVRRVNQWLRTHSEFQELYNQSITDRLSIFEEEVISIADDVSRDYKEITVRGSKKRVPDAEVIARAKLRVDVRFKHLKAGKPTKWGDSTTIIAKNENEFDPSNFSADELEKQIADIETKARIVRPVK